MTRNLNVDSPNVTYWHLASMMVLVPFDLLRDHAGTQVVRSDVEY